MSRGCKKALTKWLCFVHFKKDIWATLKKPQAEHEWIWIRTKADWGFEHSELCDIQCTQSLLESIPTHAGLGTLTLAFKNWRTHFPETAIFRWSSWGRAGWEQLNQTMQMRQIFSCWETIWCFPMYTQHSLLYLFITAECKPTELKY